MKLIAFKESLSATNPPGNISPELQSIWYASKNDWENAHQIAQDIPGKNGSWIHAYLHRVEGDQWNADYWYRQAGKPSPNYSLEEELDSLVRHFTD